MMFSLIKKETDVTGLDFTSSNRSSYDTAVPAGSIFSPAAAMIAMLCCIRGCWRSAAWQLLTSTDKRVAAFQV
jgi:hypothetical protein